MFKARLKPSEQGTLERRYAFHLGEAIRASLRADQEKAAGHAERALPGTPHRAEDQVSH